MRPLAARTLTRLQLLALVGALLGSAALWLHATRLGDRSYWIEHRPEALWITTPQQEARAKAIRIDRARPPVFTFERAFRLRAVPASARLHVRALRDWTLRVNGHAVAASEPGSRGWKRARLVDVAPWLRPGTNQISVEVVHAEGPVLLQLWSDDLGRDVSTRPGWRVRVRDAVGAAVVADDVRRYPFAERLPVPADVLRAHWPWLLGLFALGAAAGVRRGPWPRALSGRRAPRAAFALVAVFWLALGAKAVRLPADLGFDAEGHLAYVDFLARERRLPRPEEGWETFHPPLYYVSAAGLRALVGAEPGAAADKLALRLLPMLAGLSCAGLAGLVARRLAPAAHGLAAVSVLAAGLLPMNVYMATFVSNEPVHAALVGAGLWLACEALVAPRASPRILAWLSIVLGLALVTKSTTSLPVAAIVVALVAGKLWLLEARSLGRSLLAAAGLCAGPLLIAGWFYVRNAWLTGDPFVSNLEAHPQWTYWIPPGFHTSAWFLGFGEVLSHPYFASFASYWDGLYSSFWGDGYASGKTGVMFPNPWWDYETMAGIYPLALPATALLGLGLVIGAVRAVRDPDPGRRLGWVLLLAVVHVLSLMLLLLTLRLPYNAMPKAFYALPGVVPVAVCFAAGVTWLHGRFSGPTGDLVRALLSGSLWLLAVWIGFAFLR